MGLHGWEFLIVASWFIVPALVLAAALLLVYWMVRRAVAAGIRDAKTEDPAAGDPPRVTPDPAGEVPPGSSARTDRDTP